MAALGMLVVSAGTNLVPGAVAQERPVAPDTTELRGLQGEILDAATDVPVSGVMVAILDEGLITLTDDAGYFHFPEAEPGRHEVGVYHVGFTSFEGWLDVAAGEILVIRVEQAPVVLEGIDVEVLSRYEREWASAGERFDFIAPADMEVYRERYSTLTDVLRAHQIPGIFVSTGAVAGIETALCVQHTRGTTSVFNPTVGCAMIAVDDVIIYSGPMAAPGESVFDLFEASRITLEEVESVRWLSRMEAMLRYGEMGERGALVIRTRGSGFDGEAAPSPSRRGGN